MTSNSPEMFINMKDVPSWDRKKHYFDQSKSAIQFYEEEINKIKNGITINGVFIHPWLYWHLNFFKTPIPNEKQEEVVRLPDLRDNEWYFMENYMKAEKQRKGLAMFGTRRFSKSTLEASLITWLNTIKANGKTEVVGGDAGDLGTLSGLIKVALVNMHPAIALPRNKSEWDDEIIFGLKTKSNDPIDYSHIIIKNANKGGEKDSEKGAGLSPIGFVIDEFGKFDFLGFWNSATPSFETAFGWKCVPVLAGTGGNEKLSRDANTLLSDPEGFNLIPMDWDSLENKVGDPDLITWKRTKFGMYVPAQMSYHDGVKKEESNLGKYLKVEGKELTSIRILVTNWETSKKIIQTKRDSIKDRVTRQKQTMYYPLSPEECFLNKVDNPFPALRASEHKKDLIERGETGKLVDIYSNPDGTLKYELSDRLPIQDVPFTGGTHDAPVIIFDDPPEEVPAPNLNVSGLDPYKQAKATTDSAGAFYVLRRESELLNDPMSGKILASYVSRPPVPDHFDRTCLALIKGYGAHCLMESADYGFIRFMETKRETQWLVEGIDLARTINPRTKAQTSYGLFPTEKNKAHIIKRVLNYCNEEIIVGFDDQGVPKYDLGVIRINDIYLLEEIIHYFDGMNCDRIVAFGHALAWMEYLDELKIPYNPRENQHKKKKKDIRGGMYNKNLGIFG